MFDKTLRALIIVLCSTTTFYAANIAPTAAYATGAHGAGGGGGAGKG